MKRSLFESIKAVPYTPGQVVDRIGALSAVLGISVSAADEGAIANITVTHADTADGTFTAVQDERLFLGDTQVKRDENGAFLLAFALVPVEAADLLNIEIDLLGCKQFVKVDVAFADAEGAAVNTTAAYTLTLGDFTVNPAG